MSPFRSVSCMVLLRASQQSMGQPAQLRRVTNYSIFENGQATMQLEQAAVFLAQNW